MLKCNHLNPFCDIIHTNKNIFLVVRRWVDRSNEIETSFFKRFNREMTVKWHFIWSCRTTHVLALLTMLNIMLAILMKHRLVITYSKNLLCNLLSTKCPPQGLVWQAQRISKTSSLGIHWWMMLSMSVQNRRHWSKYIFHWGPPTYDIL